MDDSHFDGLGSLIRFTGVSIPSRARFIGEAIGASLLSGLSFGLVCGQAGALMVSVGPLVPFMIGTWVGQGIGFYAHWKRTCNHAEVVAEHYPQLLCHALWTSHQVVVPDSVVVDKNKNEQETPQQYNTHGQHSLKQWMKNSGLGMYTYCILAATECSGAIEEVENNKRQALVERLSA